MTGARLALAELRARPGRATLTSVGLALVLLLALSVTALADGLVRGSTGVLRALDADVVVTDEAANHQLLRSRLVGAERTALLMRPDVATAGQIGLVPTSASVGGGAPERVTAVGFSPDAPAMPRDTVDGRLPRPGEPGSAAVDVALAGGDVVVGDTLSLAGEREVEVVGLVDDASFLQQPTVWLGQHDWARLRQAVQRDADYAEQLVGATVLQSTEHPEAVATAITEEHDELAVTTREGAVAAVPGVSAQQVTLGAVVAVTLAVAVGLAALIGVLQVLERRALLTALRAVGAPARTLLASVAVRGVLLWVGALIVSTAATVILATVAPPSVPMEVRPVIVASVGGISLVAATLGVTAAAWPILSRLDPQDAVAEEPL